MSSTRSVAKKEASPQHDTLRPRVPPSLFTIALGLAGLGVAWHAAMPALGTPQAVPNAVNILAAAAWLVLVTAYAAQGPRQVLADLHHPVLAPFVPVAAITAMILAAALARDSFAAARILVIVVLAVTIGAGGWLTGQWFAAGLGQDSAHPGYYLPTVAGGLVGAFAAAQVHLHAVAEASFGIGVLSWIMLGSVVWNRLFFRPGLPEALVPTLAILLVVPVLAGLAYFALTGGATNLIAAALGGYAVLMALVQIRLLPVYAKLKFTPGFWAFTFPAAAAATDALGWITLKKPPGGTAYAVVVVALVTALIAAIATRTVIAATRGQLLVGAHAAVRRGPGPPSDPAGHTATAPRPRKEGRNTLAQPEERDSGSLPP
jgi:tellurite resistance protein